MKRNDELQAEPIEGNDTARLEAFSDGVFAIAITLLVLDLKVPRLGEDRTDRDLGMALLGLWPSYMAFVMSFLTILIMWINHHRLFQLIRRSDHWLMATNGLVLLLVTAVPFPTSVLAEYYAGAGARTAVAFYAGFYVMVNIAFNLLWLVASKNQRLLSKEVSEDLASAIRWRLLAGLPAYCVATALAFISPILSLALCLILWVHWATLDRYIVRNLKPVT